MNALIMSDDNPLSIVRYLWFHWTKNWVELDHFSIRKKLWQVQTFYWEDFYYYFRSDFNSAKACSSAMSCLLRFSISIYSFHSRFCGLFLIALYSSLEVTRYRAIIACDSNIFINEAWKIRNPFSKSKLRWTSPWTCSSRGHICSWTDSISYLTKFLVLMCVYEVKGQNFEIL